MVFLGRCGEFALSHHSMVAVNLELDAFGPPRRGKIYPCSMSSGNLYRSQGIHSNWQDMYTLFTRYHSICQCSERSDIINHPRTDPCIRIVVLPEIPQSPSTSKSRDSRIRCAQLYREAR
jgi:hypothetical protein